MSARQKRPEKKPSARRVPAATFDDAVALLLQLEPGDTDGFQGLSDVLETVAAGAGLNPEIAGPVRSAKERIETLVRGEATDAEAVLIEISRLLDAASNAREEALQSAGVQGSETPTSRTDSGTAPPENPPSAAGPERENADPESLPADADLDLMMEFITESRELLESSEAALLVLESNPEDFESVNTVFRAFHTVKGTSGFLCLQSTSELAHLAESLLSRIRNKEIRPVGGYADLALKSVDMLKKVVTSLENALRGAPFEKPEGYDDLKKILSNPEGAGISEHVSGETPWDAEPVPPAPPSPPDPVQEKALPLAGPHPKAKGTGVAAQKASPPRDSEFESSIRVNTERLDRLIDMVGELVIAQSMVSQDRRLLDEHCHELLRKVNHAGKIVRELQDLSMSMRMIPLRNTFQKMQRVARDLARKCGKSVELVADDGEAEIDRHMVDILNDVLVHMVRNAIDHGIESQEERKNCGKDPTGTVRLLAFHSGGNVVVEIHDDGRGLDHAKILQKAVAAGLIDPDKPLSDSEVFNMIFAPGLSTSERVTDISGRGVGMDVVRKGVESLHGRVDIVSEPGVGSTFTVRLPLTLAVTDGMLVRVGSERYIIPTISIHLCFRPGPEALSTVSGRGEIVMLRGKLMPVFRLHRLFGVHSAVEDPAQGLLVVVGDEEKRCALLVDELMGQQQVVAKSLTKAVGKVPGISGGAILGDGQVGLILDPREIAVQARRAPGLYSPSGLSAA